MLYSYVVLVCCTWYVGPCRSISHLNPAPAAPRSLLPYPSPAHARTTLHRCVRATQHGVVPLVDPFRLLGAVGRDLRRVGRPVARRVHRRRDAPSAIHSDAARIASVHSGCCRSAPCCRVPVGRAATVVCLATGRQRTGRRAGRQAGRQTGRQATAGDVPVRATAIHEPWRPHSAPYASTTIHSAEGLVRWGTSECFREPRLPGCCGPAHCGRCCV